MRPVRRCRGIRKTPSFFQKGRGSSNEWKLCKSYTNIIAFPLKKHNTRHTTK
nr:MAG TPA: hypothetical protein [Caudoviricetes sp.]